MITTSCVCVLIFASLATALPVHMTMEENINVTIRVRGEPLTFNLTKNEHVTQVPIYIGNDDGIVPMSDDTTSDDFAAYIDEDNNAAFVVTTGPDGEKQYHGVFNYESQDYVIEPRDSPITSRRRKRDIDGVEVESEEMRGMMLYEADGSEMSFDDDMLENPARDPLERIAEDSGYTGGYRSFGVKMLIAVDYKVYRSWRDLTRSSNDARYGIRHYFTHVVNGIDLRYRSIRESRFGIYVKLAGIYIAETTGASYWTMMPGIREADVYSQGYKALEEFEGWVADEDVRRNLPLFDQATLFTGNTLFRHRDDGSRRPFSGLAAYDSICRFTTRYGSASINHDAGIYASIQTGAHELGHNLGSRHDSSNTNGCDSSDQYIMAVSPGTLHEDNFQNTFTFSRCSIDDFRQFLLYDLADADNCLLNREDHESSSEVDRHLRILPGTEYDADHQCQLIFGTSSFYCAGGDADEAICHRMHCYDPETRECEVSVEQRAYDGTTCGNRKWCEDGECVYDRYARRTEDSCVYGDFRDVIRYVDLTCEEMVEEEPYRCYDEKYFDQCCASCAELMEGSSKECPYGDKRPSYCKGITSDDCYPTDDGNKYAIENCCGTCEAFSTGVRGCEYGDKASWCSSVSDPGKMGRCYDSESTCCESCPKIKTDNPGCEYGDRVRWCASAIDLDDCERGSTPVTCCATCRKLREEASKESVEETVESVESSEEDEDCQNSASWCDTMFAGDCYHASTRKTCCKKCSGLETSDSGCEYGDRASWCKTYVKKGSQCDRSDTGEKCCDSCRKIREKEASEVSGEESEECEDKASWCASLFPGQCYTDRIRKTCCKKCSRLETSDSSCKFGDKYTWCHAKYCNTQAAACCDSCR